MYYPKTLSRFSAKVERPISLKSLATEAALKLVVFSGLNPNPALNSPSVDELSDDQKDDMAEYLEENLPRVLHRELFVKAVKKWYGADRICGLAEVLWRNSIGETVLDFIGPFRYAYGCYYSNDRLYWSNGTIERLNLDKVQCDNLFLQLNRGREKYLRSLSISTQKDALKASKFPSILARAEVLHSVVILNGATDHILRLLGLNCHSLKLLDVSHSQGVSDTGMRNLLLRNPRPPRAAAEAAVDRDALNPCAKSLSRIIVLGTEVTTDGHEFASRIIEGYSVTFIPDSMIVKPEETKTIVRGFELDTGNFLISLRIKEALDISQDDAEAIERTASRFVESIPLVGDEQVFINQLLDCYSAKKGESQMFIRLPDSRIPQAYLRMELNNLTQLILPWHSFTWRIPSLPDVTELATALPNLTLLKARLQGAWDRDEPMFPKLKHTYIWTIHDSTVISFLRHCPTIEHFKFNCLDFSHLYNVDPAQRNNTLSDWNVQYSLFLNQSLLKSLVEVSIRPASRLTESTVNFMIERCPKLLRLGDMESWDVSADTLKDLNKNLDEVNSKCVLTVLSFPPFEKPSYLL